VKHKCETLSSIEHPYLSVSIMNLLSYKFMYRSPRKKEGKSEKEKKSLRSVESVFVLISDVWKPFAGKHTCVTVLFDVVNEIGLCCPDMTMPRCTRQSFLIVLESMTSLINTLTEFRHSHLLDRIYFRKYDNFGGGMVFLRNASRPRHVYSG